MEEKTKKKGKILKKEGKQRIFVTLCDYTHLSITSWPSKNL